MMAETGDPTQIFGGGEATRCNTKGGNIVPSSDSTPKVEKDHGVIQLHQKCISSWRGLADFLRDHQGEWYSPYELHKVGGGDIRTVKNMINRLADTSYWTVDTGYRIEIAQRGGRIYCVRFVRDLENSVNSIKARIAEVGGIKENIGSVREADFELLEKHCGCLAERDAIRHHAQRSDAKRLREDIHDLKESRLGELRELLRKLEVG